MSILQHILLSSNIQIPADILRVMTYTLILMAYNLSYDAYTFYNCIWWIFCWLSNVFPTFFYFFPWKLTGPPQRMCVGGTLRFETDQLSTTVIRHWILTNTTHNCDLPARQGGCVWGWLSDLNQISCRQPSYDIEYSSSPIPYPSCWQHQMLHKVYKIHYICTNWHI